MNSVFLYVGCWELQPVWADCTEHGMLAIIHSGSLCGSAKNCSSSSVPLRLAAETLDTTFTQVKKSPLLFTVWFKEGLDLRTSFYNQYTLDGIEKVP